MKPGRILRAILTLAFLFSPRLALAHTIGLSTGEYQPKASVLEAKLAFARAEIAMLAPALDANGDGHLSAAEVASSRSLLFAKILDRIEVTAGGKRCPATITDAALTEQDGLLVSGRFSCEDATSGFDVELALLDDLPRGHNHVARAGNHDEVLRGDARKLHVPADPTASSSPRGRSAASFFAMGIEHILTGYDHLVFLLGLVLARGRLRSLLAVVTAFTVAHSITLALAALDVWTPSSRIVEPAIALSIAYVGIENFFVKDASKRWRVTFPFGLIHGFGFADALKEVSLPRADVPAALVSFNLGVEVGQIVALALVLPLLSVARRTEWFEPRGVRVLSGAIAVAGGVWFVTRAFAG